MSRAPWSALGVLGGRHPSACSFELDGGICMMLLKRGRKSNADCRQKPFLDSTFLLSRNLPFPPCNSVTNKLAELGTVKCLRMKWTKTTPHLSLWIAGRWSISKAISWRLTWRKIWEVLQFYYLSRSCWHGLLFPLSWLPSPVSAPLLLPLSACLLSFSVIIKTNRKHCRWLL